MQDLKRDNLIFGRYRLHQSLGKGSFGEVFYAEDIQFDPPRAVAFKLLRPEYTSDPQVREDLKREAGILARFDHPNILRVLDFGITEDIAFIVMDLAQGGSLARRLRPDPTKPAVPIPFPEVANYLDQIADALDEAHDQGLIHRDIKPQNILLDRRGRLLVADFGLATAVTGSSSSVMVDTSGSGTPLYMSPEQWQGRAGRASDIYSLGAVLFQMLTGQPPFHGNQYELFGQHLNTPVPRLSERAPGLNYPAAIDDVIAHAMTKDPRQRIRPAKELAHRFRMALVAPPNTLSASSQPTLDATPTVVRPPLNNQPGPPKYGPLYTPNQANQAVPSGQPPTNYPNPNNFTRPVDTRSGMGQGQGQGQQATSYQNLNQAGFNPVGSFQGGASQSNPVSGSNPPNRVNPIPVIPPPAQPEELARTKKVVNPLLWVVGVVLFLLIAAGAGFALVSLNKGPGTATPASQVTTAPALPATTVPNGSPGAPGAISPAATTAGLSETVAPQVTNTTGAATTAAPATTAAAPATTAPATTPPTTVANTPTPAPFGTNLATFNAHSNIVLNMAFSPDGTTLATASEDGTVKLWNVQDQREKASLKGHSGPVRALAYSPDGKLLVTGSADKSARVWDANSGQEKFVLNGHTSIVTSVAFAPDGKSIATGSDDRTIRLWNAETGKSSGATLVGHKDNVVAVAYAPDGKTLASGARDSSIKLWDLGTSKEKQQLDGHNGSIWSVAFSHDGKTLASGSLDKTTRLWETNPGKLRFLMDDSTLGIRQVAFTPDDKYIATACDDKIVYLWGVDTGLEKAKFEGHATEVFAVAISPDGKTVASGSKDGIVKLWSIAGIT